MANPATGTLKLVYHTAKLRLGFLIMACTLTGVVVTPGHSLSALQVLILGIATLVASSAAGAFNQFYEHELDGRMSRTRGRPFVTGRFERSALWAVGIVLTLLLAVAAATVATNWLAAFFIFLGAFTYGIVYTVWLKQRTWLNIVIGGLAGSFAILAGSAAAGATASPVALILAAVLFLWTPPHFWALAFACRSDYRAASVPMLPCVVSDTTSTAAILAHAIAVVGLSILPVFYGLDWIYLSAAVFGGSYFLFACLRLFRNPGIRPAWHVFAASIVQLGLLLTGAILDALLLG